MPLTPQKLAGPEIAAGVAGVARVTEILRVSLALQPETTTETLPVVKVDANLKLIDAVPCPLTLVAPDGIVHK